MSRSALQVPVEPPKAHPAGGTATSPRRETVPAVTRLAGEVVYMYAFDVAYEMVRDPAPREVLGQPVTEFVVGASKRGPRQWLFYRPQIARLPPVERAGPRGTVRLERAVKILPIGSISITVRMPFEVASLEELVTFHELQFSDGRTLYEEVRQLVEDVRRELRPFYVRPVEQLRDEEAYTVFCVRAPLETADGAHVGCESWLMANRRSVASLLTEEEDPGHLSEQEATESTGRYYSYYDHDLAVVDWDAALIIDEPRFYEDELYVMELANVQLAELEAYDRMLDEAVERSYRDLGGRGIRVRRKARQTAQRELREIRVDMSRLSDELSNITKFFGDWHLARIYQGLGARFHLADWHRAIDEKLKTLDDLYQLLRTEQNNRQMLILEALIVLLFIVDLVILAVQTMH
jgi:hypothetical protein